MTTMLQSRWVAWSVFAVACDPAEAPPSQESGVLVAALGGKADDINGGQLEGLPPFVTLVNNGRDSFEAPSPPYERPALRTVSSSELDQALGAVSQRVTFADYPFSGCHDRAHIMYLTLADELGSDAVAKIWVFSPTLLTVALDGVLISPVDSKWGVSNALWDYHVAAIVETSSGTRAIDPVLSAITDPLTLEEWFGAMTIPPGSAYTTMPGRYYLFNRAGPSSQSAGRMPLNGEMYEYVDISRNSQWMERNLARDAVAVSLTEGSQCSELQALLIEPQLMVDALGQMESFGTSAACQPALDLFEARISTWSSLVNELL